LVGEFGLEILFEKILFANYIWEEDLGEGIQIEKILVESFG
jgi:hypothetical protein